MTRRMHGAVVVALGVGLLLTGCTSSKPTLLEKSDFDGAVQADHEPTSTALGRTWCKGLNVGVRHSAPHSTIVLSDDGWIAVGAAVLTDDDQTGQEMLTEITDAAAHCAETARESTGLSIEPLDGLKAGTVGWRTSDDSVEGPDGVLGLWGEYAVMPIDGTHLLAVGFETIDPEPPVDLDELIRLAREGVERVGLDG